VIENVFADECIASQPLEYTQFQTALRAFIVGFFFARISRLTCREDHLGNVPYTPATLISLPLLADSDQCETVPATHTSGRHRLVASNTMLAHALQKGTAGNLLLPSLPAY
jgi:hypothetical protein